MILFREENLNLSYSIISKKIQLVFIINFKNLDKIKLVLK